MLLLDANGHNCMARRDRQAQQQKKVQWPFVDEDWHAICQAIFQGVEGSEWETCITIRWS